MRTKKEGLPPVRTTDGFLVPFDREYIVRSLLKETATAPEVYGIERLGRKEIEAIAKEVEEDIRSMRLKVLSGALIRELVNTKLLERGYGEYRNLYARVGAPLYEVQLIDAGQGFEAKENANLQPNPETIHKKKADVMSKEEYLLLLPPPLADAHWRGDLHIHDLEYFGARPFCQDHDLRYYFYYGLKPDGTGYHTAVAGPAKHPEVAILHATKVLGAAQTNFSGGQGLFGFTFLVAPYLRGLNYKRVKQLAQMFIYECMQEYVARGGQPVFSSISIEAGVPKLWRDVPSVIKGEVKEDEPYGDFEEETNMFANALLDVFVEGDAVGKMFVFPKPEVALREEYFKRYPETMEKAAELSARFGGTYYDNLIPEYRGGDGVTCYQCCAYSFKEGPDSEDFEDKLYFRNGAHFSMGGMQVVTLNMPRLAYKARGSDERLFEELERVMDLAKQILLIKRKLILKQAELGMIPFATQRPAPDVPPAVDLESLSLTIGVLGLNEMTQFHAGYQLHESDEAMRFAVRTIVEMERIRKEIAEETGLPFAIARTPAESAAQRLAVIDLIHYPEQAVEVVKGDLTDWKQRIVETRDLPVYYNNGTHVYIGAKIPLGKRIEIEHKFFPILSGGNIFHVWLGEAYPNREALMKLTEKIATETWIGYFAYTKDLLFCARCKLTVGGLHESCPNCGSKDVHLYSRITGYYQDAGSWNAGKRRELVDRYRVGVLNELRRWA